MSHTVVDVLPRDAIQSIDDPSFSRNVDGFDDKTVIVVETTDSARAYPTRILQEHEVVNDSVADEPIAVTWCPLCGSAVVYDRRVDDRLLTFGVSGKLADNDLVLYDRETESEWKQSSGHCLAGEYEDETLTMRPAATMTWAAFRDRYPDGRVLQPPEWGTADYGTDRFATYAESDSIGPGGEPNLRKSIEDWSHEFHPKTPTLGVTIDGESRGYPRPIVEDAGGVVTDTVGDTGIAVFATPSGIFAYESEGRQFETTERNDRFRADGTEWDAATGQSTDGRTLPRLPGRRSFAFAWQDDHGQETFYSP